MGVESALDTCTAAKNAAHRILSAMRQPPYGLRREEQTSRTLIERCCVTHHSMQCPVVLALPRGWPRGSGRVKRAGFHFSAKTGM